MPVVKIICLLLVLTAIPAFAFEPDTKPLVAPESNATKSMESSNSTNSTASMKTASNATFSEARNGSRNATMQNSTIQNATVSPAKFSFGKTNSGMQFAPLAYLSFLRSQLEVARLQVKLAEEKDKLQKINSPKIVTLPTPPKQESRKVSPPAFPKILSIQGVNGNLSATLTGFDGVQTVKTGEKAGRLKIVSISPSKVLVRYANKNVSLKFKE